MLLWSLTGLEDGGGNEFFGEPMFDVHDLMRTAPNGHGIISCLELPAVQDKPKLFSTALMWLLAELFEELPEAGDLDKPKLAFFFDEAHLLFDDATKAFLESVAQTVRLIRSKGVGVYFITQSPKDVPGEYLGQLGNRVQHALRAFTPEDARALKATVSTFPKSAFYDIGDAAHRHGHRRGGGDDPVRDGRADPGRAHPDDAARSRWDRPTTSTARPRRPRCGPSTASGWTTRAPGRYWPPGWHRRPLPPLPPLPPGKPRRPPRTSKRRPSTRRRQAPSRAAWPR